MLKREQNHIARHLPKKPSGTKPIVCHHCGAFSHLRPHCSKFQTLKRIKRKDKLKLLGSCALQAKPDLIKSGKLLKHVVNAFTSLSMCISGFYSCNPRLTSHETLIPNNCSVWMRKDSCGWTYAFFYLWYNSFDLCRTRHALAASNSCICASCISLYALFLVVDLTLLHLFCVSKNSKTHKKY